VVSKSCQLHVLPFFVEVLTVAFDILKSEYANFRCCCWCNFKEQSGDVGRNAGFSYRIRKRSLRSSCELQDGGTVSRIPCSVSTALWMIADTYWILRNKVVLNRLIDQMSDLVSTFGTEHAH